MNNQCFPVEQDGIVGWGRVAGLAVGFRGPWVLCCFVTHPMLCCSRAVGDITWGGYRGTAGVDVQLRGPDGRCAGAGAGLDVGAGTDMEAARPGCSVLSSWGRVCSVQPPKGSSPGCLLIQGTFRRSFRVPITPHRPPLPSNAEHCTWPLFSSHALRGICTWLRGTEMSQHLSRYPVTSGLPATLSCQDLMPQFPSCVALVDCDVSAAHWHYVGVHGGPGGALWWEPFARPPWQWRGSRGAFVVRISQGLTRPMPTLNLQELPKDGVSEKGVV